MGTMSMTAGMSDPNRRIRLDLGGVDGSGHYTGKRWAAPIRGENGQVSKVLVAGGFKAPFGFDGDGKAMACDRDMRVDILKHCGDDAMMGHFLEGMGHCKWDRTGHDVPDPAAGIDAVHDLSSNSVHFYMDTEVDTVARENGRARNDARAQCGMAPLPDAMAQKIPTMSGDIPLDGYRSGMDMFAKAAASSYLLRSGKFSTESIGQDDLHEAYMHVMDGMDEFMRSYAAELSECGFDVHEETPGGRMSGRSARPFNSTDKAQNAKVQRLYKSFLKEKVAGSPSRSRDSEADHILNGVSTGIRVIDGRLTPVVNFTQHDTASNILNANSVALGLADPVKTYGSYVMDQANKLHHGLDHVLPGAVKPLKGLPDVIGLRDGSITAREVPGLDYTKQTRNLGVCTLDDVTEHFNTCAREFSIAAKNAGMLPNCLTLEKDGRLALKGPSGRDDATYKNEICQFGADMNAYLDKRSVDASTLWIDRNDYVKDLKNISGKATQLQFDASRAGCLTQEAFHIDIPRHDQLTAELHEPFYHADDDKSDEIDKKGQAKQPSQTIQPLQQGEALRKLMELVDDDKEGPGESPGRRVPDYPDMEIY